MSGYLFAVPEDGGTDSVEVDTHAWVEALLPSENGGGPAWVGADPTNRKLAGEEHVKIGHGRFTATCRRSRASIAAPAARPSTTSASR